MFLAKTAAGRLINLLEEEASRQEVYYCPACAQPVRYRAGQVMRPHFAHRRLADCQFFHENESAEHLELKAALFSSLVNSGATVAVEAVLADLGQVADLLVNHRLALEVQCSRLSQDRLRQRTQAYHQAGYQVLWLLGRKLWLGNRLSPLQKDFLYFSQNMGFHLWELDVNRQEIRLRYLLHEDLRGRIVGKTKVFSLSEDLLMIWRQPFVRQPLQQVTVKLENNPQAYIQRQLIQRNPKWLKRQAEAYRAGDNLLTWTDEKFYPQVRPVSGQKFCQITQDLSDYYSYFLTHYQKEGAKKVQTVFSPQFYAIMKDK